MLPAKMVKASLAFVEGKYTQPPNVVLVPAGVKTFPITVEWSMQSEENYIIGSHDPEDAHRWCVLDADLKQVMQGAVRRRQGSKKAEPLVSRTLHGGGAHNPRTDTFEFAGGKLKNAGTYVLIASRHGVLAAGEFVAVHQPGRKAAAKKKAVRKVKAAPKKSTAKVKAASKAKKGAAKKSAA